MYFNIISLQDKQILVLVFAVTNIYYTSFVPKINKNNLFLHFHMTIIPYLLCICFNIKWVIIIAKLLPY